MTATYYGRRYKGVKLWKDRHGKPRCTYRLTGVNLPIPGSVTFRIFDQAYWAAAGAKGEAPAPKPRPATSPDGTVEKAFNAYMDWLKLQVAEDKVSKATLVGRQSLLGTWAKDNADKRLRAYTKANVEQGLKNRKATPPTANNWLYAVRSLFKWCIEFERYGITADPTQGVELLAVTPGPGFTTWTEPDVVKFVAYWGPDAHGGRVTMEYRALMVLLWSGQRRKDVVTFGWHKFQGDMMLFTQSKTDKEMSLPIPPDLIAALPPRPADNVRELNPAPFLLNKQGNPFKESYFTNWFHAACMAAGLDLAPHGTRKLAAQRMYRAALRSGHPQPLALTMAFTGHETEKQLRVYLGKGFEQKEYAGELGAFMLKGGAA